MNEIEYSIGPRILPDGRNMDADIIAVHPIVLKRQITDPVSDGSLGDPGYEPGQYNQDGTVL
jgi:hypothetical protein